MSSQYAFFVVAAPLVLMILGAVILSLQSRMRWRARDPRPTLTTILLVVLGWAAFLAGLFVSVAMMANIFAPFLVIVTAIVVLSIRYHYQRMEQRYLLWILMVAAERGIPLEQAARDFAEERRDWIGARALDLAEYLEAGLPLTLAAKRSGLALPPGAALAADIGQQTGDLGPALRRALSRNTMSETVLQSARGNLSYLMLTALFGLCVWVFILIRIVPSFARIFVDFGTPLPIHTLWMIDAGRFVANYWLLVLLVVVAIVLLVLRAVLYYAGMSTQVSLGPGRLEQTSDGAVIMRWLAVAVGHNRPIGEMLRLLAGYFPRRSVRRKLDWTARRIDQGAAWSESLAEAGLIRRREAVVFSAAQRTGNLAWALEEMAESKLRRAAYRLRAAMGVLFPAMLLILGLGVLFVALGCLTPLAALIARLA